MGVMSVNLTMANESWVRKGDNYSQRVNTAIQDFRIRVNMGEGRDLSVFTTMQLLRGIQTRCMGKMTKDNPLGTLSAKEYERLVNAINALKMCIDEMDSHEVVE
jgi:hypothetical protein